MIAQGRGFKLSIGEAGFKVCNYTFLAILGLLTLYPFYYILITSFEHPETYTRVFFWPTRFFYANYYILLSTPGLWWSFLISVLRLATAVPAMLLVTSATAFVLTRKEMLFRTPIILYFFFTMFYGGGLIPYYLTVKAVGLYDSFLVYVIPVIFSVWTMIIMKTMIQSLPQGLVDAALMDGASYTRIYLQVILPLSKAMLAVLGMFAAVGAWNDWFTGLFYIETEKLRPLQTFLMTEVLVRARRWVTTTSISVLLSRLDEESHLYQDIYHMGDYGDNVYVDSLQRAAVIIALVPIVLIYPFLQRFFVKGVLIGSIKE